MHTIRPINRIMWKHWIQICNAFCIFHFGLIYSWMLPYKYQNKWFREKIDTLRIFQLAIESWFFISQPTLYENQIHVKLMSFSIYRICTANINHSVEIRSHILGLLLFFFGILYFLYEFEKGGYEMVSTDSFSSLTNIEYTFVNELYVKL